MFGIIVPGRKVEQVGPVAIGTTETEFYSSVFNAEGINEVAVFLSGQIPFSSGMGAAVIIGSEDARNGKFLGYISNNKPSDIFKVSYFKRAEAGSLQNPSEFHVSSIQIMISVKQLTSLEQESREQVSFFDNFNAPKASKSIFKKVSDLPCFVPMKVLKVERASNEKPNSKGKMFVLLGNDEVHFNLPIEEHKKMVDNNGYEFISNSVYYNQNPFCFAFKRRTGTTTGIGVIPFKPALIDKAAAKAKLGAEEIPPAIREDVGNNLFVVGRHN